MSSAHSPSFQSLHLRHSSFSNPSLALSTSQFILPPFRCFTYVTAHSPTLLSLLLRHRIFHLRHLASRPWFKLRITFPMTKCSDDVQHTMQNEDDLKQTRYCTLMLLKLTSNYSMSKIIRLLNNECCTLVSCKCTGACIHTGVRGHVHSSNQIISTPVGVNSILHNSNSSIFLLSPPRVPHST